ncbi:hypothetical protein NAC44_16020 [Allorhizobium sp. BGMRC 0089]|nr:hypothetical protein [Allorhizobium sonneratiae]
MNVLHNVKLALSSEQQTDEISFKAFELSSYALTEEWTSDLGNGVLHLGANTADLHGFKTRECGLLTMVRSYDPRDRSAILDLFEKAATQTTSFCFATTILHETAQKQPVFCIGRSMAMLSSTTEKAVAPCTIKGVFIFPVIARDRTH